MTSSYFCAVAAVSVGTQQPLAAYLLTLLVAVYALLEVAVELNTLSSSARAAYLSEDALD